MKYKKIKVSSNKEFEKNMAEFGARMAEFGSKMANLSSKNFDDDFCIFNDVNFSSQNGTSIITKDEKTIITTRNGDEIVLENGEIFFNNKKMKVVDDLSKESEQVPSNNFEKKLKNHEIWLIFMVVMIGVICVSLLFQ